MSSQEIIAGLKQQLVEAMKVIEPFAEAAEDLDRHAHQPVGNRAVASPR